MANHTQIRLVQVTGSVVDFKPAAIAMGQLADEFAANDLSGSLQYFAQALSNIHGNTEFGAQTPGTISFADGTNVDIMLDQNDTGQKIHLDSEGAGADGVDIDSAGGVQVDAGGVISIDAADDSNFTVTAAAKDLVLSVAGGGAQKLQLDSAGTGTDAVDISASAGGVDIDAATSVAVNATTTLVLQGNSSATFGDDTEALAFDGSGNVDFDAVALDIDASGAITMDSTSTIVVSGDAGATFGDDTEALAYDGSGNLDLDAVALDVDTSGAISIVAAGVASDILIQTAHTEGVAFHIDANADAASEVQIDAGILDIDVTGAATMDAVGIALGAGSGELDLTTTGTVDVNAGVLDIDVTAGLTLDATTMSIDGTDDSNITVTAAAKDLVLAVAGGGAQKLQLDSAGTGTDAIDISASAGGIDIDATTSVAVNATTTLVLQGNGSASFGDDVEALAYDGSGNLDLDALALDIDASNGVNMAAAAGGVQITSAGDAVLLQVTSDAAGEDLTIQQAGANDSGVAIVAAGTGADAIKLGASAGGIDIDAALGFDVDAAGAVALDSTAASMTVGALLADGQTLKLGKNGAVEMTLAPHGTPANEVFSVVNTAGSGAEAIKLQAIAGSILMDLDHATSVFKVDCEGTTAAAIDLDSAGGIEIDAAGAIGIESTGGAINIGTDNAAQDISIGTQGARNILLGSAAGQSTWIGQALVMSGTSPNALAFTGSVSFSSDGLMTSGEGAKTMLFASYDDFAIFRGKSIFSASDTVISALNTLASNITGATATIFTGSLAANVAAGSNVTVAKLSGDNASLSPECGIEKCQVFVNGQLLVSSSIGGTNDYQITAANTLQFQFVLQTGDMVQVIDRS